MSLVQSVNISPAYYILHFLFNSALFVFPIAIIIALFLLRKTIKTLKRVILVLLAIYLLILSIGDIKGMYPYGIIYQTLDIVISYKRTIFPEIPVQVKSNVDKFIVGKVGKDNYAKYIKYLPGESYRNIYSDETVYTLYYDFSTYDMYGDFPIVLIVNNSGIGYAGYSMELPDCVDNPSFCQFNLSGKDLEQISTEYNLGDYKAIYPPYIFFVPMCSGRMVRVNYITKAVDFSSEGFGGRLEILPCFQQSN